MSTAIGTRQCGHLGCHRRAMTTANERADGPLVYAFCEFHMALALSHAFAPRSASAGDSPSAGRGVSQSVPALSAG